MDKRSEGIEDIERQMQRAREVLASLPDDLNTLLGLVTDPDHAVRLSVISKLVRFDDPRAVEGLLRLLEDESGNIRREAAWALGRLAPERAAPELLEHARSDPSDLVRASSIVALAEIGGDDTLAALVPFLSAPQPRVRDATCIAFGIHHDRRAVQQISALLDDPDPGVRYSAARVLVSLGSGHERIVRTIQSLRSDANIDHLEKLRALSAVLLENPDVAEWYCELLLDHAGDESFDAYEVAREHIRGKGIADLPADPMAELEDKARKLVPNTQG